MVVTRSSRKSHGVSTEVKVEHAVVQVKVKQEPAKRAVPAVVKKEPQERKRKRSAPTSAAAAAAAGGKRAKVKQEPRATVKQELRASVKQEAKVKVEAGAGTKATAKSDGMYVFSNGAIATSALPESVTGRFGELVWVKQRGFPYWPAYVYDPSELGNTLCTQLGVPSNVTTYNVCPYVIDL